MSSTKGASPDARRPASRKPAPLVWSSPRTLTPRALTSPPPAGRVWSGRVAASHMGLGWSQPVVPPLSPVRTGQDEAYKNAVDNLTPAHLDEFNEAFRRFDSNSSGTQCPRPIVCTLRAPSCSSLDFAHQWCLMRNTNARAHTKQAQTPTQACPYTHALCSRSRSLSLSSLSLTHTFLFVTDALSHFPSPLAVQVRSMQQSSKH